MGAENNKNTSLGQICTERLQNGIIKENPTFILMLGMCPTLAVTTSAMNGVGMGLSTTVVLIMSNLMISLLRKIIPDGVRMPAFIVVVASFVTIIQFLMQGYFDDLYASLGLTSFSGSSIRKRKRLDPTNLPFAKNLTVNTI